MRRFPRLAAVVVLLLLNSPAPAQVLPRTKPLTIQGDLARVMLDGIDRYLDKQIAALPKTRKQFWKPELSSPKTFVASVNSNRERLKKRIGVIDARLPVKELEFVGGTGQSSLVAKTEAYQVH